MAYRSEQKKAVAHCVIELLKSVLEAQELKLADARIATLGGDGAEAEIWQKAGILEENLVLVERSTRRSGNLFDQFPKARHLRGDLKRLPSFLVDHFGKNDCLRLFDWDLNGTIEPCHDDLEAVTTCLMGHSVLSVTLADARRNIALEDIPGTVRRARIAFGQDWSAVLWTHLAQLHTAFQEKTGQIADPVKVALRELSALTHIWVALKHTTVFPSELQRWIYQSDEFRMRTYAFALRPRTPEDDFERLVTLIVEAPCHQVSHDGEQALFAPYTIPETTKRPCSLQDLMEEVPMTTPEAKLPTPMEDYALLDEALKYHDPKVREAFARIHKDAMRGSWLANRVRSSIEWLGKSVEGFDAHVTPAPQPTAAKPVDPTPTPTEVPAKKKRKPRASSKPKSKKPADRSRNSLGMSPSETDTIRLELIAAQAKGREALDQRMEELQKKHSVKNACLKTVLARATGKHQPAFVARYLSEATSDEAYQLRVKELMAAYGHSPSTWCKALDLAKKTSAWKEHAERLQAYDSPFV